MASFRMVHRQPHLSNEVFVALKSQEMQHQRERQIAQLDGDGELVEDKDMDIDRVEMYEV